MNHMEKHFAAHIRDMAGELLLPKLISGQMDVL